MILGDSPRSWSASQDRAWQMLGIGPRWVRQPIESAVPTIEMGSGGLGGMVTSNIAVDLDQSIRFDQAVFKEAINHGLTARVFHWPNTSEGSQTVVKPSPQSWLLVAQTKSENLALADQLLDAMLGAVGAAWSKPEISGGSDRCDSLEAMRVIESGWLGGVLVLGREALATLGHDGQSLDELRGRAHWLSVDKTTIPVIVSFAPQALLREPLNKAGAWRDLQLAKSAQTQS